MDIIARYRAGDRVAGEALGRIIAEASRRAAIRFRSALGEDGVIEVTSEAALHALEKLHMFEGRSKLATWVHMVTTHKALMHLRNRNNRVFRRSSRDAEVVEQAVQEHIDNGGEAFDVHTLYEEHRRTLAVRRATSRLREGDRRALERHIAGVPLLEIATSIGIQESALRSRLFRVRMALARDPELRAELGLDEHPSAHPSAA